MRVAGESVDQTDIDMEAQAQDTRHDTRARQVAVAVQKVPGVDLVLLFGSRARGDYRPTSDIDLLVTFRPELDTETACREAAQRAVQDVYADSVGVDLVRLDPAHFNFMQHGLNHVAAQAAQDGITPMGYHYLKPQTPSDPAPTEQHRRESMERALHARRNLSKLEREYKAGTDGYSEAQFEWETSLGEDAQAALVHALKAVLAAHGHKHPRVHDLEVLVSEVREVLPSSFEIHSELKTLSAFAGGEIYGSPELNQDVDRLLQNTQADVFYLLRQCQEKAGYDSWTVTRADFKP